jgi:hypothetical protein
MPYCGRQCSGQFLITFFAFFRKLICDKAKVQRELT